VIDQEETQAAAASVRSARHAIHIATERRAVVEAAAQDVIIASAAERTDQDAAREAVTTRMHPSPAPATVEVAPGVGSAGSPARTPAIGGRRNRLRVAVVAPPWIPVPPPAYGGIESVVALLCEGLVDRGVDVTLFAAPGSTSRATVHPVLPRCYPDRIGGALHEADHVATVFDEVDAAGRSGHGFDVIHDHCGFTGFAMADRVGTPVLHTLHGPFDADTFEFYRRHAAKATAVAISRSQAASAPDSLRIAAVIPNPADVAAWPFVADKDDYVLWVGRMVPEKGPHRAIAAARSAGVRLILAGPVQSGDEKFFHEQVAPGVDGDLVRYVGEVGGAVKRRLFASARGLLMPIRWPEPFGMVMVEALSAGTPVIAHPEGAAPEIVDHGLTGYLVHDEDAMAAAINDLHLLDPRVCREQAQHRFGKDQVAAHHEATYRAVIRTRRPGPAARGKRAVASMVSTPPDRLNVVS
jgi:glycosyltransferase involved in cell wall biosynthesis